MSGKRRISENNDIGKKVKRAARQRDNTEKQQLNAFYIDSSGNQVPTGVSFPQNQLSLISHKKIKSLSQNALKENLRNAANQTQPTLPTDNSTAPPLITTSFRKSICASKNHDEQYADHLANILMGNTQNSANGNNKQQMIDLNQSFVTAPTSPTSTSCVKIPR
ncbi:uncharacterized protein LOC103317386 [Nasonia vitripennis]|uniref:Uncharacterized protein n=1 Tax=Nasonia vitripennis TaxID=7425 RepID=A0A7M7T817_NASVI|nr:uncharacterized protein LOC103317386 [Nasonia vitripennis]